MFIMIVKIILIFALIIVVRAIYSLCIDVESLELIFRYTSELLFTVEYDIKINYYEEMQMSKLKYVFSFWLWGIINTIKPEYRKVLKPYIR